MADRDSEVRHILEGLTDRMVDNQQAQRGWSQGFEAFAARSTAGGSAALSGDELAIEFATGFDGTLTVVGFSFDVSPFDGAEDLLL